MAASFLALGCGSGHPCDVVLVERFESHRAELGELVRMFQADEGLKRVGDGFTRPEDPSLAGVSADRIAEYRRLCAAVGARDGIEGYAPADEVHSGEGSVGGREVKDPIWIHVSSLGLAISGSGKGYIYSRRPQFPVVADLDTLSPTSSGTWLRHLEGDWYLYYDHED